MGKEAKFGVGIILFLLVTFCAVLAWRLRGPSDERTETASGPEEAAAAEDASAGDDRSAITEHSVAKPANATLVEASSGDASGESPVPVGQWNAADDEKASARAAPGGAQNPSSLSYMPVPPVPAKIQDPYGDRVAQDAEPEPTRQDGPPRAPDSAADGGAEEQVAVGPPPVPSPDPGQQGADGLRLIEPPAARPDPSGGAGSGTEQVDARPGSAPPDYAAADRPLPALPVTHGSSDFGAPGAGEAARTEDGKYTVQPNDSYWVISQKLYGTGAYFKALAEHNRDRFAAEGQLAVGDVISAPKREDLEEIYPGLCPKPAHREVLQNRLSTVSSQRPYGGRTYVVQEGDTLFGIARYELGKASRWVEIYELNRHLIGSDHDYLPPGVELVLPDDGPAERLTQQPDAGSIYRR